MAHWSEAYLGRVLHPLEYDCLDLAVEVARQELGLTLTPPPHAARPWDPHERAKQIATLGDAFAERVAAPVEGHPILLYAHGVPAHIGVATVVNGQWQGLHNLRGMGVVLEPLSRLRIDPQGGIEGFYRWKT